MNKFLLAYGSTPHTTTGRSPAELLYGRKMSTKLPEVADWEESEELGYQQPRDRDSEKKQIAADFAYPCCRHQRAYLSGNCLLTVLVMRMLMIIIIIG